MPRSALISFKYKKNPEGQFFPVIPLRFYLDKKRVDSSALIDSGATISIFREDVADYLGVEIERGKEIFLGGVGGRIKGYIHKMKIETGGKKFICPIVFSHEFRVSFNLLGREGFFKHFKIIFDEKRKKVFLN
jgi:hypothetical protein